MKQLLRFRYDGGAFCGYQVQPGKRTVQGEINRAAAELFGVPCDVTGCSRTDSGVHANCFFATVTPKVGGAHIPTDRLPAAMNVLLSEDVAVTGAFDVPDGFHPRYDVTEKEYIYLIRDDGQRDPFQRGRVYRFGKPLFDESCGKMNAGASVLVGTHDFLSFMANGSKVRDTVRSIRYAGFSRRGDGLLVFTVCADGFLYQMVRILVGTLLDVGTGRFCPDDIRRILDARDRRTAGNTAPACGLYLNEVRYPSGVLLVPDGRSRI